MDGVIKGLEDGGLGEPGQLLACSLALHSGTSRSPSPECPLFFSLLHSVCRERIVEFQVFTQFSLLDKVRPQPAEKGDCRSPVGSCFFPEVLSLDSEHRLL